MNLLRLATGTSNQMWWNVTLPTYKLFQFWAIELAQKWSQFWKVKIAKSFHQLNIPMAHKPTKNNMSTYRTCAFLVDDGWTEWTDWGVCSKSCGHGVKYRKRMCKKTGTCSGYAIEEMKCGLTECKPPGKIHEQRTLHKNIVLGNYIFMHCSFSKRFYSVSGFIFLTNSS